MEQIFIINPKAGKPKRVNKFMIELERLRLKGDNKVKVFVTKDKGQATKLANYAAKSDRKIRIYACGGDGTINEVLQGIVGYDNVEFGCIPLGSGNDFIKNFNADDFLNLDKLMAAPSVPIDIIRVEGDFGSKYCINAVSFSWDSRVAIGVGKFKKIPLVKGTLAYGLSAVKEMIKRETTKFEVKIDDEEIPEDDYIVGICANGSYYGGGFKAAPFAMFNDGLFELLIIRAVSRRKFIKLFSKYKAGSHLGEHIAEFEDYMIYRQGGELTVSSKDDKIPVTIDGEGLYTSKLKCEMLKNKIKLIMPDARFENAE